jgi:hypothetical protein
MVGLSAMPAFEPNLIMSDTCGIPLEVVDQRGTVMDLVDAVIFRLKGTFEYSVGSLM